MFTSIVVPPSGRLRTANSPPSAMTRWRIPVMPCDSRLCCACSGMPMPLSSTSSMTEPSATARSTVTCFALAYLITFVSDSCRMR